MKYYYDTSAFYYVGFSFITGRGGRGGRGSRRGRGGKEGDEIQIKSGSYSPCPHPTIPNYGPAEMKWMYKDQSGVWTISSQDIIIESGNHLGIN